MNRQDDHYMGALVEDMYDKITKIMEILSIMAPLPAQVKKLSEDVDEIKADVKVIKHVVTSHSKELKDHDHRIKVLETA